MDPLRALLLMALGVGIGTYGTLIGSGGGFLLVPLLIFLYPTESTGTITSISLAVVFVNALSGSVAYGRQGHIDYRVARIFGLAAVPGSIIGALIARNIPREIFDLVFGVLLIALAAYLVRGPMAVESDNAQHFKPTPKSLRLGLGLSGAIGVLSSALGIGGGVMQVPMMAKLLKFPLPMAIATSQPIVAAMALTGTLVHILGGEFQTGWRRTLALSVGVLIGAQLGAMLSRRIGGLLVVRLLAGALAVVGARLIAGGLA